MRKGAVRQGRWPLDLLVSGHTNIDRFLRVEEFPAPDRTEAVLNQQLTLGGTAANIARCAASGGLRVGLLSRVGADFPREFERKLRQEGVSLAGFQRISGKASPTCWIIEPKKGRQRTLIEQGAMGDVGRSAPPAAIVRKSGWIHLTTGDPEYQLRAARLSRSVGGRVAADPGQEVHYLWKRATLEKLLSDAEILFGNRAEIHRVVTELGVGSVRRLLEHVSLIVMTEGPNGSTGFSRAGVTHVKAVRPRRERTLIGAGDAYRGGFYVAWLRGEPLQECLVRAGNFATQWIERGGGPWLS